MHVNDVSGQVVDAAMKVHTALGPGLLESAYEGCLLHELRKRGQRAVNQVGLPVVYDGLELTSATGSICSSKTWSSRNSRPSMPSRLSTKPGCLPA